MALEKEMIRLENLKIEQQAKQEALRADLLRMISHDLRTPLTSISGNAGLLLKTRMRFHKKRRRNCIKIFIMMRCGCMIWWKTYCL